MAFLPAEISVTSRVPQLDTSLITGAANAPLQGGLAGLQFASNLGLTREQLGTMAARIAANNAKNQNVIDTMPGLSAATNATNLATTQLTPAETTNKLATLQAKLPNIAPEGTLEGLDIANKTAGAKRIASVSTQADEQARAQAEAAAIAAQGDEAAAYDKADAVASKAKLDSLTSGFQVDTAPEKFQLIKTQLEQKLKDAPDALARQIALTQGKIDLQKAQAQYYIDHGQFMLGYGRQTGKQTEVDPEKAVASLDTEIKRMDSMNSGSGVLDETGRPETLGAYRSRVYAPDGTVNDKGGVSSFIKRSLGGEDKQPTSKDAETLLQQRKTIENHKALYLGKIAQRILDNNGLPGQQQVGQGVQQQGRMPQLQGPASLLQGQTLNPQQATQQSAISTPAQAQPPNLGIQVPPTAIAFLKAHPEQAKAFEQKYGVPAIQYLR